MELERLKNEEPDGYFGHSPWLCGDLDKLDPILSTRKPQLYRKNEVIFRQFEPVEEVFVVFKGRARLVRYNEDGAEKHIFIAEKGCLMAESAALAGDVYNATAQAIVESLVYRVPANVFLAAMEADSAFAIAVSRAMAAKVTMLVAQVTELSFDQSGMRVKRSLMNLAKQYGVETTEGVKIGIKFTHEELASLVNTSRVTVSNVLGQLAADGVIQREKGYYYIKKMDVLRRAIQILP